MMEHPKNRRQQTDHVVRVDIDPGVVIRGQAIKLKVTETVPVTIAEIPIPVEEVDYQNSFD